MTGITIKQLCFNDGTKIALSPQDIVVFVGPNNIGKSQSLRDIDNAISNDHGRVVVQDVEVEYHNASLLRGAVEKLSFAKPIGSFYQYSGYQYSINSSILNTFREQQYVDGSIKRFLVSMVKTEERLITSDPKTMANPGKPNEYPLQYVTIPDNRQKISYVFERLFSQKIFCEDRGSSMVTLHMGDEIEFDQAGMTPQQVSDELYKRIESLPKVHEQGDGIRSLAGLLLNLMMPNYTVFLIDEPEAFLHPPQARALGESLPALLGERQTFISTHSLELLKGLLSSAERRIKIIRVEREGDHNPIHYLDPNDLITIWNDPIMRHSNILDGLFYHHTVICESDSDCLLYSAMLDHIKDVERSNSEALFVLCNGKGRMKSLSKTLKSLGIDFRIIPDIDFFNDEFFVRAVYENCGGIWSDIADDFRLLFNAMNLPDGTMIIEDFIEEVRHMIKDRGWSEMTKPYTKKLGMSLPQILESQWDILKRKGVDSVTDPAVKDTLERLILKFNTVGVFPVKKGELESFFPEIGSHGPGYAVTVLEKYSDLGAQVYDELHEFVKSWGI